MKSTRKKPFEPTVCPRCKSNTGYGNGEHYCTPKVDKKSKFNTTFDQPLLFQENSEWVISRELYTQEQAYNLFKEELDGWGQHEDGGSRWNKYTIDDVKENRVRYSCQGFESGYNGKLIPLCGWWLEGKGKGSKPVWVLQVSMRPKKSAVYL